MFWHRSIYKPICIEYTIDDDFNAVRLLDFEDSKTVFSEGELIEMMKQLHEMLVKVGVPYRFGCSVFSRV